MSNLSQHSYSQPHFPRGLQWSELWIFAALIITFLYAALAAIFSVRLSLSPIRHFPFLVLTVGIAFHALGASLFHRPHQRNTTGSALRVALPFSILGLFVILGSLYARHQGVVETYLTFGVYLLLPFMLVYVFGRAFNLEYFIDRLVKFWIFFALVCGIALLVRGSKSQAIHEIEFMVLPVFFYAITARNWLRWPGIIFFLAVIGLNGKLTGYLVGSLCFVYSLVWESVRAEAEKGLLTQGRGRFIKALLFFALIAGSTYYFLHDALVMRGVLATGNTEVRMHQYEIAFDEIAQSPVLGDYFSGGSGTRYKETTGTGLTYSMNIPTHSDLLDVLKHGGIIGFLLLMWGLWRTFKFSFSGVTSDLCLVSKSDFVRNVAFLELVCLSLVLVIAVNPVLLQPSLALVFWVSCGLVLASRI